MFRRAVITAALASCVATTAWAQTRATYVLSNGEKHNGTIVLAYDNNNITQGKFHVNVGGADRAFEQRDVAVIDFAGGAPSAAERQALPDGDTGLMVMRDGSTHRGSLHNILGDQVQWVNEGGQRNNFPISNVRRLYLRADVARNVYFDSATGTSGASGATGQVRERNVDGRSVFGVRVEGNQPWVDSGIDVRRGDRLMISSSGQVRFASGGTSTGAGSRIKSANYPVPELGAGALIARVGDGAPFAVGTGNRTITMPDDGRFQLGVNDDDFNDNSGSFQVTVRKP